MNAERPMRVERGAGGPRIFGDQLQIAEGGDQGHDEGHDEGQPDDPADLLGDLAGERVDAGAENVADDEQQEQPGAHHPVQARLGRGGRRAVVDGNGGHPAPLSQTAQYTLASRRRSRRQRHVGKEIRRRGRAAQGARRKEG